jgi:hypothetical protein
VDLVVTSLAVTLVLATWPAGEVLRYLRSVWREGF